MVRISITGQINFSNLKRKVASGVRRGIEAARDYAVAETLRNLDNSTQYAPLSRRYLQQKQRRGLSLRILEATGQMRKSIRGVLLNGGRGFGVVIERQAGSVDVVAVLTKGSVGRNIPPRDFITPARKKALAKTKELITKALL